MWRMACAIRAISGAAGRCRSSSCGCSGGGAAWCCVAVICGSSPSIKAMTRRGACRCRSASTWSRGVGKPRRASGTMAGKGLMTSETLYLVVRFETDAQDTIYDANGLKQVVGTKQVATRLPRGLYRLHLDRCGFACDHLILHDAVEEIVLHGPRVESPAPIEIASGSSGHAEIARRLSARDTAPDTVLGTGPPDARLFLFVRRTSAAGAGIVPSEPV